MSSAYEKREGLSGRTDLAHRTISREELDKRKALIPADTRDLTARLMGDPIPGDRRWQMFQGENMAGREGHWWS